MSAEPFDPGASILIDALGKSGLSKSHWKGRYREAILVIFEGVTMTWETLLSG